MIRTILSVLLAAAASTSYAEIKTLDSGSGILIKEQIKMLAENKTIEDKFGDQCPVKSEHEKNKGILFDQWCLRKVSNWKYHDYEILRLHAEVLKEEQASEKVEAEKARVSKLPGVRIGMTAGQVLTNSSWGSPNSINRTVTARRTSEQWVYGNGNYLYFSNGVLTAIQN